MGTNDTAVAHLKAVTAAPIWRKRLNVTYVYQAAECGGKWFGANDAELEKLGLALEAGRADAYSHWCAETTAAAVPYLGTDRDGGDEKTFEVSSMDSAIEAARKYFDSDARVMVIAPDGDEEFFGPSDPGES